MTHLTWLWIPFTLVGAAGQVARNAMQRGLTGPLGTLGATHIRFLFGFPFAVLFLVVILFATGEHLVWPDSGFGPWLLAGSLAQIAGTALMLAAMHEHSFVVTTAYLKTEAIQAAVFGFVFLADHLTGLKVAGILIATIGVVMTALRPGAKGFGNLRPTLLGLFAASFMALSAVGYRGAILEVKGVSFMVAASFTLAVALLLQTLVLSAYLIVRKPGVMTSILETLDVRGFHGRVRLALLVSRLRADPCRQRAHAGARRGADRAGGGALRHEAVDHRARDRRRGADPDRRGIAGRWLAV
jgi:drug/metabolite transporter (DMT)-like permease